jgi:Serine dehydrogenase proteinase
MSKNNQHKKSPVRIPNQERHSQPSQTTSLLDAMVDGRELESLVQLKNININALDEIRKALKEVSSIRKRPVIAYLANVVNPSIKAGISIEHSDDLPFSELVNTIPSNEKDIDIILVTSGGSGTQVAKFVDILRNRFNTVSFIIPNIAMSAGTIFAMSGDEIIMTSNSYLGPIDPQVPNKDGIYMPAQAILTLIEEIQNKGAEAIKKGVNPDWTDLQILRQIDPKEIGNAINASKYSVELVENYLHDYKFRTWVRHKDGTAVTPAERKLRANEIANQLCKHSLWKTHGRGITREAAWEVCKLKIIHSEAIDLDRPIKRLWALIYWLFENSSIFKIFVSDYYSIMRSDPSAIIKK